MTTAFYEATQRGGVGGTNSRNSDHPGCIRPIEKSQASQSPKLLIQALRRHRIPQCAIQRWCFLSATEVHAFFVCVCKEFLGLFLRIKKPLDIFAKDFSNLQVPFLGSLNYIWKYPWRPREVNCSESDWQFLGTYKSSRQTCYPGFLCLLICPGFLATLLWFCWVRIIFSFFIILADTPRMGEELKTEWQNHGIPQTDKSIQPFFQGLLLQWVVLQFSKARLAGDLTKSIDHAFYTVSKVQSLDRSVLACFPCKHCESSCECLKYSWKVFWNLRKCMSFTNVFVYN